MFTICLLLLQNTQKWVPGHLVGPPTKFQQSEAKIGESASVQHLLTLSPQKTRQSARVSQKLNINIKVETPFQIPRDPREGH